MNPFGGRFVARTGRSGSYAFASVAFRFALLLLFWVGVSGAQAQSTFGSIRGTVQDATGGVIPNAAVTVHSLDQNFNRQATTNDAGEFLVENLVPGRYSLTVEVQGQGFRRG